MNELVLKVKVEEANLILEALGQMPFKQVYALVGKIQEQASQQLGESEQDGAEKANG
jgi:hypothetical protein